MKKSLILIRFVLILLMIPFGEQVFSKESHVLKVFFRYGSVPARGYEDPDYEEVGGLLGGHVSLGLDSTEIGFTNREREHLISNVNKINSVFYRKPIREFEEKSSGKKYVTFVIPISDDQYYKLLNLLQNYIEHTPYDYAFFGMRCTSATYEVLSHIGLFPEKSRTRNIQENFYPELLRRKMFRLAREKKLPTIFQEGRET